MHQEKFVKFLKFAVAHRDNFIHEGTNQHFLFLKDDYDGYKEMKLSIESIVKSDINKVSIFLSRWSEGKMTYLISTENIKVVDVK